MAQENSDFGSFSISSFDNSKIQKTKDNDQLLFDHKCGQEYLTVISHFKWRKELETL